MSTAMEFRPDPALESRRVRDAQNFASLVRFEEPISDSKIGRLVNIDSKTVWHHWKHYQKFGLEDGDVGRPRIFAEEQTRAVVDYAIAQFC
jgi:hypothetical protein